MFKPVSCRHLKTLLDIGDIVGVTGPMKRTDKGELSIVAQELQVRDSKLPFHITCIGAPKTYDQKDPFSHL